MIDGSYIGWQDETFYHLGGHKHVFICDVTRSCTVTSRRWEWLSRRVNHSPLGHCTLGVNTLNWFIYGMCNRSSSQTQKHISTINTTLYRALFQILVLGKERKLSEIIFSKQKLNKRKNVSLVAFLVASRKEQTTSSISKTYSLHPDDVKSIIKE